MKKKILATIVLIILFIMLASCNNDNNDNNSNSTNNTNNNKNNSTKSIEKYTDGRDFSDGVAWVRAEGGQWQCIDKTGKIMFKLESGGTPTTDFSNDLSLVKRSNRTIELINKKGETISSPKSGEYDEILEFLPDIGMIIVYKNSITLQATEDYSGIIDNNGNWLVRLRYNENLVRTSTERNGVRNMIRNSSHIGNGFFVSGNRLYNIYSDTVEVIPTDVYNNRFYNTTPTNMKNGYSLYYGKTKDGRYFGSGGTGEYFGSICSVNKEGEITAIIKNVYYHGHSDSPVYVGNYNDGLFFYKNDYDGRVYNNNAEWYSVGFYDINGNLKIDLSYYDITNIPEFSDGYCLLLLKNPQGTKFYTIIDKNGREMFEPKLLQRRNTPVLSCGLVIQNENGIYSIINTSGTTVIDLGKVDSVSDYSEDVAMVRSDGEVYYIDKTGKRLF